MSVSCSERVIVPVRTSDRGFQVLVTGRRPDGVRVGIAFTSPEHMIAAMGAGHTCARLQLDVLRELLRPLEIERIQVDPYLIAPDHRAEAEQRPLATLGSARA